MKTTQTFKLHKQATLGGGDSYAIVREAGVVPINAKVYVDQFYTRTLPGGQAAQTIKLTLEVDDG